MRVLILTADIGAGHDLPAELLAAAIRERDPGGHVLVTDGLAAGGRGAQAVARGGAEVVLERLPWLFDAQYWLGARRGPPRGGRAGGGEGPRARRPPRAVPR